MKKLSVPRMQKGMNDALRWSLRVGEETEKRQFDKDYLRSMTRARHEEQPGISIALASIVIIHDAAHFPLSRARVQSAFKLARDRYVRDSSSNIDEPRMDHGTAMRYVAKRISRCWLILPHSCVART